MTASTLNQHTYTAVLIGSFIGAGRGLDHQLTQKSRAKRLHRKGNRGFIEGKKITEESNGFCLFKLLVAWVSAARLLQLSQHINPTSAAISVSLPQHHLASDSIFCTVQHFPLDFLVLTKSPTRFWFQNLVASQKI